jgi:hypothetical protein
VSFTLGLLVGLVIGLVVGAGAGVLVMAAFVSAPRGRAAR